MTYEDLKNKNVIVTGASRAIGIGAAVCRMFAAQGSNIFFTTYTPYDAEQVWGADANSSEFLEELRSAGVKAEQLEIDLSTPNSAAKVLKEARERLGAPDILVNNAAYSARDGFQRLDAATLDAHYAVNMRATFLLSTGFAKTFTKGEGGRIISLSSGQGTGPTPQELAYAATKGAIEAFTLTLAREVAHLGITVNAVDPGVTDTGWLSDDLHSKLVSASQAGRLGVPADAARLILFLASEAGQWITGQVLHSRGS